MSATYLGVDLVLPQAGGLHHPPLPGHRAGLGVGGHGHGAIYQQLRGEVLGDSLQMLTVENQMKKKTINIFFLVIDDSYY